VVKGLDVDLLLQCLGGRVIDVVGEKLLNSTPSRACCLQHDMHSPANHQSINIVVPSKEMYYIAGHKSQSAPHSFYLVDAHSYSTALVLLARQPLNLTGSNRFGTRCNQQRKSIVRGASERPIRSFIWTGIANNGRSCPLESIPPGSVDCMYINRWLSQKPTDYLDMSPVARFHKRRPPIRIGRVRIVAF
jgi:hypothetical protein